MTDLTKLLERMSKQLAEWDMDEARADWWQYQRDFAEAFDLLSAPAQPVDETERLRAHIAEQIEHVEQRIKDGVEMGAAIWRIALEDVARENRAALRPQEGEVSRG